MTPAIAVDSAQVKQIVAAMPDSEQGEVLRSLQVAAFVAIGGGFLGQSLAERPASFYLDTRCGRLPLGRRALAAIRKTLIATAEAQGLNPNNLPKMPRLLTCGGVF